MGGVVVVVGWVIDCGYAVCVWKKGKNAGVAHHHVVRRIDDANNGTRSNWNSTTYHGQLGCCEERDCFE